jgi:hypothetical protein
MSYTLPLSSDSNVGGLWVTYTKLIMSVIGVDPLREADNVEFASQGMQLSAGSMTGVE